MSRKPFQFDSFDEWINFAEIWLTGHPEYHPQWFKATCVDAKGRICQTGKDFTRARDDGTFPVRWWWPDEPITELDISNVE